MPWHGSSYCIVFVPLVGTDGKLVDATLANGGDELANIETRLDKLIG